MKDVSIKELVIATHNPGKLIEFRTLLNPYVASIVSAGELELPEPLETGTTFLDNAFLKARAAAKLSGRVALADDSGLCVSALMGAPGLYSARWAGKDKNFMMAMERIHREMGTNPDRSAYFQCVLVLAWPEEAGGTTLVDEGRVDGTLVWPPRGTKGHGYDPIFVPQGHDQTFGEMDADQKNALSHRGQAIAKLLTRFLP